MTASNVLEIGVSRVDITTYEPGLGLMGWGYADNRARGVAMPLHARTFVLRQGDHCQALVVADLCFITQALRQGVVDALTQERPQLGLDEHNVMLGATHTHSAPGGTSHHIFYNTDRLGFSQQTIDHITARLVEGIVTAHKNCVPGRVRFGVNRIPEHEPVVFNRAVGAYNKNADVTPVHDHPCSPQAADRDLRLLSFETLDGGPLGSVNWFAVHCTSVHRDNTLLHPDNKGYAALTIEQELQQQGARDYVAAFGQAACGDITPNFRWHPDRKLRIGVLDDDDASARLNGEIQARYALPLLDADRGRELPPGLDAGILYADMSSQEVVPDYAGGAEGVRTTPAQIGLRMVFGTAEGPGLPYSLAPMLSYVARAYGRTRMALSRLRGLNPLSARSRSQVDNKLPLLETGRGVDGRFFGLLPMSRAFPFPDSVDLLIAHLRQLHAKDALGHLPWTPQILPVQIFVIGDLALVAVPAEFTTVAGKRLRASLRVALASRGVKDVVLAGYCNAYAGYVTTPEEYAVQGYEGSSTHFGPYTLGAYQTVADELARRLSLPPAQRPSDLGPTPPRFDPVELARRAYPTENPE